MANDVIPAPGSSKKHASDMEIPREGRRCYPEKYIELKENLECKQ